MVKNSFMFERSCADLRATGKTKYGFKKEYQKKKVLKKSHGEDLAKR